MPRGLGRGLGALIPTTGREVPPSDDGERPGRGDDGATGFTPVPIPRPDAVDRWLLGGPADALIGAGSTSDRSADDPAHPGTDPVDGDARKRPVPRETARSGLHDIALDAISSNPRQPRVVFDPDALAELVASIRAVGLLQPVVVRPAGEPGRFELVMGERRWRAAREAGLSSVAAVVRETDDAALLRDALLENLHRADLNPLEEAAAYQQLLQDAGCSQEDLARRIGRSRPQISNTLRLLRLPPLVARRLAAGVLSAGHARALLSVDDGAAMERLAQRIVAEGLSVRSVEEIVAMGGDAAPRPRRPRAGTRHPQLDDLAARLSDQFDTRVSIALGQRKGRLTVEFASVEDLNRIVALIGHQRADSSV